MPDCDCSRLALAPDVASERVSCTETLASVNPWSARARLSAPISLPARCSVPSCDDRIDARTLSPRTLIRSRPSSPPSPWNCSVTWSATRRMGSSRGSCVAFVAGTRLAACASVRSATLVFGAVVAPAGTLAEAAGAGAAGAAGSAAGVAAIVVFRPSFVEPSRPVACSPPFRCSLERPCACAAVDAASVTTGRGADARGTTTASGCGPSAGVGVAAPRDGRVTTRAAAPARGAAATSTLGRASARDVTSATSDASLASGGTGADDVTRGAAGATRATAFATSGSAGAACCGPAVATISGAAVAVAAGFAAASLATSAPAKAASACTCPRGTVVGSGFGVAGACGVASFAATRRAWTPSGAGEGCTAGTFASAAGRVGTTAAETAAGGAAARAATTCGAAAGSAVGRAGVAAADAGEAAFCAGPGVSAASRARGS